MTARARRPFLHVASGTSTTSTIQAAGIPGEVSIWADPLYEGPVPAGLDDAELLEVRARYLSPTVGERRGDVANDLERWRAAIARTDSYDELILWFEHDLFDQLNLIQLLAWMRGRRVSTPASLVQIGSYPGRPRFKGLGELTPEELAPLLQTRQPVHDGHYEVAERAWQAFREPAPVALDDLRRREIEGLPYLAPALTRFLQEFPWAGDGLSRSERRLLQRAAGGGLDLLSAFPRMHEGEDAYYITDLSLAALAESLARSSPPLLTLSRASGEAVGLHGSVGLTEAGFSVLRGEADRVLLCGIDRWLGGVHLEGRSGVWRWDEARNRIVRG